MQKNNFFFLFIALLLLLFAIPLADQMALLGTRTASGAILSLLLVIGVWSLRGGGRFFTFGMAFAITGVILNLLTISMGSPPVLYAALLSLTGFLLIAIAFSLRQVVLGTTVDVNRLIGAVCVFLMIGVVWALFYTLVDLLWPGSFSGLAASRGGGWDSDWLYFSFVTLTTLGYGDFSPVTPVARILASLQAVVGQFYIAVLVAGLVGAYISGDQDPR